MAQLILRPTADVSRSHTCSSGSSAYAMLSEATADGDSTYIYQSVSSTSSASVTSTLTMGGSLAAGTITSITAYLTARDTDSTLTATAAGSITVGSNTFSISANTTGTSYATYSASAGDSVISAANTYLAANGALPTIRFGITTRGNKSSSKSSTGYIRVTQVYIVIEYEEPVIDGFDCAVVAKTGISQATVSASVVPDGDSCTFTATVEAGYSFKGWYSNESGTSLVSSSNPYTATISADITLYAYGEKENYTIEVTGDDNWSATVTATTAQYGDSVTFTATDSTNISSFSGWYSDSGLTTFVSSSNPYTVTVTGNLHLYVKSAVLTYSISMTAGTTLLRQADNIYGVAVDWNKMTDADIEAFYAGNFSSISSTARLSYITASSSLLVDASATLSNIPIHATVGLYGTPYLSAYAVRWSSAYQSGYYSHVGDVAVLKDITSSFTVYYASTTLYDIKIVSGDGIASATSNYSQRTAYDDFTVTCTTKGAQWEFDGWYSDSSYSTKLSSEQTATLQMKSGDYTIYVRCLPLFPIITVQTPTKTRISDETDSSVSECTFTTDKPLTKWEARAVKGTTVSSRGTGILVESGDAVAINGSGTVIVDWDELTDGDGQYTIVVYGHGENGYWSDETYEV